MSTHQQIPGITFERLGPDIDLGTAIRRARQLSMFMRQEVHGPVYEEQFGLKYIDTDPPAGTPGDFGWRVQAMPTYNTPREDGSYIEYIVAYEQDETGGIAEHDLAVAGLMVAGKPEGICQGDKHTPTHIIEIDVARRRRGTGLAPALLSQLQSSHPEDPGVTLDMYVGNDPARAFYRKLGFIVDSKVPLRDNGIYAGQWLGMYASSAEFHANLADLQATVSRKG